MTRLGPYYRITLHGRNLGVEVVLLDTWVPVGRDKTVPVVVGAQDGPGQEVGRLEVKLYSSDEVEQYAEQAQTAELLERLLYESDEIDRAMPPDPFDTGGESDG